VTGFEERRQDFGRTLRRLREATDMTGVEWAAALGNGWSQSKVSKLELGSQTATEDDVRAWCTLATTPDSVAAELVNQARELQAAHVVWRRRLRHGHRDRQAESLATDDESTTIRVFEFNVVPGLVQVFEYAREVFLRHAELLGVARDADESARLRVARQQILYQPGRRIEILAAEAALRNPIADPSVMVAQIDRLITVTGLRSVRFGVIPLGVQLPYVPVNGFSIKANADGETVFSEQYTEEYRTAEPDQVAVFHKIMDALWPTAVTGDDARALLLRVADQYKADA